MARFQREAQAAVSPLGHEDIRRLDIPVDDACGMGGIERIGNLNRQTERRRSSV